MRKLIYHGSAFYDDEQVFDTYRKRRQRADNPNDTLDRPIFLQILGRVDGKQILDLGCGDGRFGLELIQRGCKEYHGVDGSKRMIEQASRVLATHPAKLICANLEDDSFPVEAYDLVISRLVLHYIKNVEDLFVKIYQTLKPGGKLAFSVEHPVNTSTIGEKERIVTRYFLSGERADFWLGQTVMKYHRTIEEYVALLIDIGFRMEQIRESRPCRIYFQQEEEYQRRKHFPLFLFFSVIK